MLKSFNILVSTGSFTVLLMFLGYLYSTDCNHGSDPRGLTWFYLPAVILGLVSLWKRSWWWGFCQLSLAGMALGIFYLIEGKLILLDYSKWCGLGMPARPEYYMTLIVGLALTSASLFVPTFILALKEKKLQSSQGNRYLR